MFNIVPNWHPIFVHFTVALLYVAAGLAVLSHFLKNTTISNELRIVARWNLWLGVALTVLTIAAGIYAFNTVNHDTPSHEVMKEHRVWGFATFALFGVLAGWEYWLYRHGKEKTWLFTGIIVVAAGLLSATAWHGGELVYRHGLGVQSLPKTDDHQHAPGEEHTHSHAGDEAHAHTHEDGAEHHDDASPDHHHDDESQPHTHDDTPAPAPSEPAAKKPHTHPPGTPPHQD